MITVPPLPTARARRRRRGPRSSARTGASSRCLAAPWGRRARTGSRWRTMVGVDAVLVRVMVGLYLRAAARSNLVSLFAARKPVTIARAKRGFFRAKRSYVGTVHPWALARIGPQYVSAYVGTGLVRP